MVVERQLPPFLEWLAPASLEWLVVVACLIAGAAILGLLMVMVRYGPVRGVQIVGKAVWGGVVDLARISPRRVTALSWLAFREAIRRKVVVVFVVFVLLLLVAGWFLDPSSTDPARVYVDFVLSATDYLVVLLALFLSVFSLPTDIRNRTLHTVVTKPVRPSEIVLGRIAGFVLLGTVLLAVMSVVSYLFVVRSLDHTHGLLSAESLQPVEGTQGGKSRARAGATEPALNHRHNVYIDAQGNGRVEPKSGHTHALESLPSDGPPSYAVGWTVDMFLARVPIYGNLRFCDLNGIDKEKGINVGDEWVYRSYIHGQSKAAAIWTFKNVREDMLNEDGDLPIQMNIGVFRSHKGNIKRPVLGSLSLRNPKTGLLVEVRVFPSQEFVPLTRTVPRTITKYSSARMVARKIETPEGVVFRPSREEDLDKHLLTNEDGKKRDAFDLFDDLVSDGEVEVWLKCEESGQYFGAAQPDLYILARDASFGVNFFKGYFGIWLQMAMIVGFGVMFSTFLNGPVAMLATAGILVAGLCKDALMEIARGPQYGGGPIESFYRLLTQDNMITPLEPGLKTTAIQMSDKVLELGLRVIGAIIPPFGDFDYSQRVARGFDVYWDPWILVPGTQALAFLIPLFVAGFFFLKTREVGR